jgi:hypothetical protein
MQFHILHFSTGSEKLEVYNSEQRCDQRWDSFYDEEFPEYQLDIHRYVASSLKEYRDVCEHIGVDPEYSLWFIDGMNEILEYKTMLTVSRHIRLLKDTLQMQTEEPSTFTIPDHIVDLILEEGHTTDVVNEFTEYCKVCSETFSNYDPDDSPEHLWEAYEACMYPYKVIMGDCSILLRFAQNDKDLERDVLPDTPGWNDYDYFPVFEHP